VGAAIEVEVGFGVLAREIGRVEALKPSPNLVKDSIVLSILPPKPRRITAFRRSSGNPISLNVASFDSNEGVPISPIDAPMPCDAVLIGTGGGGESCLCDRGEVGLLVENRRRFEVEDDPRSPNPKNFPVFGGRGGGEPSGDLV